MTTPDHPPTMTDRPAIYARNLLFYALFYPVSAVLVLGGVISLPLPVAVLRAVVHTWGRWHRWCCRHLLGIRVEIDGALPDQPVLVAMRHESFFEAIDLPMLLIHPVVFAKQELFTIPGWGLLARRYGLIAVQRDAGARALRAMISAARANALNDVPPRPLVIFPEGTRVPHTSAPPLQAGFAGIYKMAALPVVPVAVDSGPLYHRWWKRPGVIHYRFGAPIPAGLPRAEIEARVHAAINALH